MMEDVAVLKDQVSKIPDMIEKGINRLDQRIISYANDTKQRDSVLMDNLKAHDVKDEDREELNAITRRQVESMMIFRKYVPYLVGAFAMGAIGISKSFDLIVNWFTK